MNRSPRPRLRRFAWRCSMSFTTRNPVTEPIHLHYGRYDLNGDGFTGGTRTSRFDLDRVGSTQYGAAGYGSDVTQEIEGHTVHFNETQLTDLQVLC
jgi:hypothetical protein